MQKTETIEIQKELTKKTGKLSKYLELILGEKSFSRLLQYELIVGLFGSMPGALGLFLRSKFYPRLLGKVGRNVTFGVGVVLRHPRKIFLGDHVVIDDGCVLDAKGTDNMGIRIGNGVFLGRNTILNCKNGDIVLEDNVNIGSNVTIFSASQVHVGRDNLIAAYCYLVGGTHQFDDPSVPVLYQGRVSKGIQIGPGGWLGAHVTVFDGVRIGKHAVIGAGSVVNTDIPDYAIAAGVPVRIIRERKGKNDLNPSTEKPRKRILYISMYDPHVPYTGAGARGGEFVIFLAKKYEVDVVYMTGSGHPGIPELEEKFKGRLQGIKTKIAIPFSQKGYFLFSKALYQKAVELLKEKPYDLIFCDYGLGGQYGVLLSKRFGIPFVYSSHNVEFRQYLGKAKKDFRRWPLIPYVYFKEKKAVKQCALLVAISEEDARFFSRWKDPEKIIVVPQGFDDSVYHPFYVPSKNPSPVVLFFGNYAISTNREAVEVIRHRIVDEVVKTIPNVVFRFVGANPPFHLSHPNFQFIGFVDSIVEEIQKADVVISPILKGWGMPTKVIESLACGKPVIATEVGARSVPRHYHRLKVCSIAEFPQAIVQTLRENRPVDSVDFEKLKADFLWSARLEKMIEKLESVLDVQAHA